MIVAGIYFWVFLKAKKKHVIIPAICFEFLKKEQKKERHVTLPATRYVIGYL